VRPKQRVAEIDFGCLRKAKDRFWLAPLLIKPPPVKGRTDPFKREQNQKALPATFGRQGNLIE